MSGKKTHFMLSKIKSALKNFTWLVTVYRRHRDMHLASKKPVKSIYGFNIIAQDSMQKGLFEPLETIFFLQESYRWDVVVNVGANIGYYACLARSLGKRVIAFEPHPLNYPILLKNMEINLWKDVEVFPMAAADVPGLMRLYGSGTGASLIPGWAQSSRDDYAIVPVTTLDRILTSSLSGCRVLYWIDVEGAEHSVLLGARQQLALTPAPSWVVEIAISGNQPKGVHVNPKFERTFELFWQAGYQAYGLELRKIIDRECVKNWAAGLNLIPGDNFYFTK